jgi:hypothetical protein
MEGDMVFLVNIGIFFGGLGILFLGVGFLWWVSLQKN